MALTDYQASGPYLMGRLVNRLGDYVPVSKYFPLPFHTFSFDFLENETIEVRSKNGTASIEVKQDSPIAYSDLNGLIHYFSAQPAQNSNEKLLPSMPVALAYSGSDVRKAIFFPSYLVPMAQASYEGDWLPQLYNKLSNDKLANSKVDFVPKKRKLNKQHFLEPDKALLNETTEAYKVWHQKAFSNLTALNNCIDIVEIPQLYTIVVVFSSKQFEGVQVTLNEFPANIKITGDVSILTDPIPVSVVKEVEYSDEHNDNQKCYAATFWIETELLETPLQVQQQYCRFDINLSTVEKEILNSLVEHGLPEQYSLSEQVLHLPIQTAVGRTTLVNGDPISVEEALVNHAPQYFTAMMGKINTQAIAEPQNLVMDKLDKTLVESMWHNLQTYKGFYEAGATLAEKGLNWSVLSKTINASIAASGTNSDLAKLVTGILGVSGSAAGFLELSESFKTKPALLKSANTLANMTNIGGYKKFFEKTAETTAAADAAAVVTPKGLHKFVNGLGGALNFALDKPLSVFEICYSANSAVDLSGKARNHENELSVLTSDYTLRTQSTSNQMSLASKNDLKTQQGKIKATKEKLEKELKDYKSVGENKVISVTDTLDNTDFTVQLINTGFSFDKAGIKPDENGEKILTTIAEHLSTLLDPIAINVTGHTCFIGSDEYNYALSLRRAEAFKKAIIDRLTCSEPLLLLWEDRIKVNGKGETEPLFNNNLISERYRNRRVEVEFLFNTSYQYPPCRSGISALESRRRATVAANVSEEAEWINVAASTFDFALGIGAGFLGPVGVAAYALWWTGNTLNTGMDILNQLGNKNFDSYGELKKFAEFGVVTQSMLLHNDGKDKLAPFIKKAYLKRALAINGLVRLIHRYHYELNAKPKDYSISGMVNADINKIRNKQPILFNDYDFEGYIKHFILDDSWEIANEYIPVFLDEVWLQNIKKNAVDNVNDYASIQSYISGTIYLKNKLLQLNRSNENLAKAQSFHSYFPVHFLSSKNLDYFKDMFVDKLPKFKKEVIKHVFISARPRGRVDQNSWVPLGEYLHSQQRSNGSLSPFDQIRILVVLNNEDSDFAELFDQKTPLMIPVSVKPIRINPFFNDEGNTSTEYVKQLKSNDLCAFEKELIGYDSDTTSKVYGAVINPTFLLGANIVAGTRPMADFEDGTLESLFADNKVKEHKTKHSAASGHFSMDYIYQLFIVGTDVNSRISYGSQGHARRKRPRCIFPLSLDPERKYSVKVNDKLIELIDDHVFYEKNFLEADNRNEATCPAVFAKPRIELFVRQNGKLLDINDGKFSFDWNSGADLVAIIYSKGIETDNLIAQNIDPDVFPVEAQLLTMHDVRVIDDNNIIKLTQASGIHRIGQIKTTGDKHQFEPLIIDDTEFKIPAYETLKQQLSNKSTAELASLRVIDKNTDKGIFEQSASLFSDDEPSNNTDVFAIHIPLEYINVVGKKMPGLKPTRALQLNTPYAYRKHMHIHLRLFSAKGAGLDGALSNRLAVTKQDMSLTSNMPTNWRKYSSQDKLSAVAMLQTNKDSNLSEDQKVSQYKDTPLSEDHVLIHNRNKLMKWIEAGTDIDLSGSVDSTTVTDNRTKLLELWIRGEEDNEGHNDVTAKIGEVYDSAVETAAKSVEKVQTEAGELYDSTKDAVNESIDTAKAEAGELYDSAKDAVSESIDTAKAEASELYDSAKDVVNESIDTAKTEASELYESTMDQADELLETARTKANKALDAIDDIITEHVTDKGKGVP